MHLLSFITDPLILSSINICFLFVVCPVLFPVNLQGRFAYHSRYFYPNFHLTEGFFHTFTQAFIAFICSTWASGVNQLVLQIQHQHLGYVEHLSICFHKKVLILQDICEMIICGKICLRRCLSSQN